MNIEFRFKILSGGKVILVDCAGYESEIFVPLIINNRITLQNVIEPRRCCKQNSKSALKLVENRNSTESRPNKCSLRGILPLANSTPTRVCESAKENHSSIRRFQTPDVVRRAVVENKNSVSIGNFPQVIKVVRLHKRPTPNTPNKVARVQLSGKNCSSGQHQILRNISNVSSFRTLDSPHTTNDSIALQSPDHSFLMRRVHTLGSATKWRKCITPQRTYIRRRNGQKTPVKLQKLVVKPLQFGRNGKLVPDYRVNPTKHPIGYEGITITRRKLVIDANLTITPRKFRNQLEHTEDLNRSDFKLPKNRKELICAQHTAFDLLTNSTYYPRIAKELNAVFRQGCLNKKAETILKYQKLTAAIPNCERD